MRTRKTRPSEITVGQLRKMLEDWPDESPIGIWICCSRGGLLKGPCVEATISSVDLQCEGEPNRAMITGELMSLDFEDTSDLCNDD